MLYLGADHGGFGLKQALCAFLVSKKIDGIDVGTFSVAACDYPLFAKKVAQAVQENSQHRGLLICTSGIGMTVVANKFQGIYAACVTTEPAVQRARQHNGINVLCLPGSLSVACAEKLLHVFLTTELDGAERHADRRQQIAEIEQQNFR